MDDGSTDSSGQLCDDFVGIDSRIHVLHQKNSGVSEAHNVGFAVAVGEFITFVDLDDWLEPEMYLTLITQMKEMNADVAFCSY